MAAFVHTRVHPSLLATRLDAGYYRPEDLKIESRVRGVNGPLLFGSVLSFFETGDGAKKPGAFRLLKTRSIVHDALDYDDFDETVDVKPDLLLADGDALLTTYGVAMGKVACAVAPPSGTTVDYTIAVIRPDQAKADAFYLASYLRTTHGQALIQRRAKGSSMPFVLRSDLEDMPLPKVALDAQRYIGDKVRQAERLRERARSLRREIEDKLSIVALVAALSTNEQRANRVSASDLSPRLDAKYYGSRSMAVLHAAAANSVSVGALVEEVSNGFEHRDFAVDGTPYITVTEVSGGRLVLGTAPRLGAEVSIPKKAQLDTCCALVVRTGSIGVAVPVFEEDTHAAISSHLIRLRFKTEGEAAVVAAFLNSEAGRVLQRKISYGAVQPQIGQDELLALPVPQALLDSAESILKLLTTEDAALRAARRLTASATLLVEHLIEGKVTEADLVAAQRALESGDRGPDRAILEALGQNGNPTQPLIADLDGLYALLDELDEEANA